MEIVEIKETEIILEAGGEPEVTVEVTEAAEITAEIFGGGAPFWGMMTGRLSDQADLRKALAGKAGTGHTHDDRYYPSAEVDALLAGHTHDGRYYPTAEADALLAGKADAGHTHDARYYPIAAADALLAEKADAGHTHDGRYYPSSEVDALLTGKADAGHTHDGRYYPSAEVDALLAGKAALQHIHDDRYYTAEETDTKLSAKADAAHDHDSRYYSSGETDALLAGKADRANLGALAGKDAADWRSDILHIPAAFPPSPHDHDGRYYTEAETDTLLAGKADAADLGALAIKDAADWTSDILHIPAAFPPSPHDHDDRYYPSGETDALIAGKADVSGLADLYDPGKAYAIGDLVMKDCKFCRCVYGTAALTVMPLTAAGRADPGDLLSYGRELFEVRAEVNWNEASAADAYVFAAGNPRVFVPVPASAYDPLGDHSPGEAVYDGNGDFYTVTAGRRFVPVSVEALLAGKSNAGHDHDGRYHLKAELDAALALLAPLASPALSGTPTAPTASVSDDSAQIATTAFVRSHDPFGITGSISAGSAAVFTDSRIDQENWHVQQLIFGTPSAVTSDVTWTTNPVNRTVTLNGSFAAPTGVTVVMEFVQ